MTEPNDLETRVASLEKIAEAFIAFTDTVYDAVIDLDHAISAAKIEGVPVEAGEKEE